MKNINHWLKQIIAYMSLNVTQTQKITEKYKMLVLWLKWPSTFSKNVIEIIISNLKRPIISNIFTVDFNFKSYLTTFIEKCIGKFNFYLSGVSYFQLYKLYSHKCKYIIGILVKPVKSISIYRISLKFKQSFRIKIGLSKKACQLDCI